jgi:signal peptidase II
LLALLVATALKLWFDFPRPPAVLGDMVRVIGDKELHYSLPSGHATYAALVVGALWPLMGRRGRISLMLYATLVGWSRIAAGMHFPADVLAGWTDGAARHSPGGCCRWPPLCGNRLAAHRLGSGSPWPPVLS